MTTIPHDDNRKEISYESIVTIKLKSEIERMVNGVKDLQAKQSCAHKHVDVV